MMKIDAINAYETARELVKENIKSTERWVTPEEVVSFMEVVSDYLTTGSLPKEE